MNKFLNIINLGLNLTLISLLVMPTTNCGHLTMAINRLDTKEVEKLLAERISLTQSRKNKLLSVAKESIKNRGIATYELSKSKKDLARIIFGAPSVLVGGYLLKEIFPEFLADVKEQLKNRSIDYTALGIGSGISALSGTLLTAGVIQLYRGWNLHSANLKLQKAFEIKELIKNHTAKNN